MSKFVTTKSLTSPRSIISAVISDAALCLYTWAGTETKPSIQINEEMFNIFFCVVKKVHTNLTTREFLDCSRLWIRHAADRVKKFNNSLKKIKLN